ncbi:MAG: hypothetical protein RL065_801 [Bacteroidota bacterium]|jgi:hypothetical protein
MQLTDESLLVQQWIQPLLVNISDDAFSFKSVDGSWGKMNKKILLISKPQSSANADSELLKKVISLTQNFEVDDFFYLPLQQKFPSLLSIIEFTGAETILFFNVKPSDVCLYQQAIVDLPYYQNQTQIVFLPIVEQCITHSDYKKHFARVWLKMLNTSWIKK